MTGTAGKKLGAVAAALFVVVATVFIGPGAAQAATGDASAFALRAALTINIPPISQTITGTIGAVVATPGGPPATSTLVGATAVFDPAVVLTTTADIEAAGFSTSASSDATASQAHSSVTTASVGLLGSDILGASAASADAVCTVGSSPTADANLATLTLFGIPTTIAADGSASASAPLTGAFSALTATVVVTRVESVVGNQAIATALIATVSVGGSTIATVTLADARCETPAVTPVTATSINPSVGPTTGGQSVTITGTGFNAGTTVSFNGNSAAITSVNAGGTSLVAVTPPGAAGPANVAITNLGTLPTNLSYTYIAPTITGFSPAQGPEAGGTTVTITGTGLDGASSVSFGSIPVLVNSVSADGTQVQVTTPAGTGLVPVTVTLPGPTVLTAPGQYLYVSPTAPVVTGINPNTGPTAGGTNVTITGTGLANTTSVAFDGNVGVIVGTPTATSVTVTTPPGAAGPVDVVITSTDGITRLVDGFTYVAPPGVMGIQPSQGPTSGGTTVTVTGNGFVPDGTAVSICGVTIPASSVTVSANDTSLTFKTPGCAAGNTNVTVTTAAGSSAPLTFRYVSAGLASTGVSFSPIPVVGGLGVTLLGALLFSFAYLRRRKSVHTQR